MRIVTRVSQLYNSVKTRDMATGGQGIALPEDTDTNPGSNILKCVAQ